MSGDRRDALIVRRRVWQTGAQGWCGLVQVGAGWCRLVAAHGCTARVGIGSEGFRACEGVYDLQAEPLLPLRAAPAQTSGRNSQLRQPQSHASPIPCKLVAKMAAFPSCPALLNVTSRDSLCPNRAQPLTFRPSPTPPSPGPAIRPTLMPDHGHDHGRRAADRGLLGRMPAFRWHTRSDRPQPHHCVNPAA